MAMASCSSVQDAATQADKGAKPLAFQPEQFIAVLNNLKSGGSNIPADIIRENVYEQHPMQLLRKHGRNGGGPMLFFYELQKTGKKAKRKISSSLGQENGQWIATKAKSKIRDKNGSVIGTKTSLIYYQYAKDGSKKMQNTNWHMKEYRLPQNQTANKLLEPTVCEMYYGGSKGRMEELKNDEFMQQLDSIHIEAEFLQQQNYEHEGYVDSEDPLVYCFNPGSSIILAESFPDGPTVQDPHGPNSTKSNCKANRNN
ncbi:hypothetical protein ACH5RR_033584 [Cinchona calisaya]|uniref:NAC domain-containing protein n=1 Tax=Cinchona calisaya TaxID=153742 RepID=A0ABD2YQT2_9GENT